MFTLAIVALLSTGLEYNIQHFDTETKCILASFTIEDAYEELEPDSFVMTTCEWTYKA